MLSIKCRWYTVYMLDQRPLLYKGPTQIVASLVSKMKHLVAAAPDQAYNGIFSNHARYSGGYIIMGACMLLV